MLKLETTRNSGVLSISGRVGAENLSELKLQMEAHPSPIVLELGEVTLADADAVEFLAAAEADGSELRNCPLFIREWIRSVHRERLDRCGKKAAPIHRPGRDHGAEGQRSEKEK
ncbi:MAG: hypothetical protein ACLP00_14555 [Terracidiphilus sp.]